MPALLHITTPENVTIRYRLAGPAQRGRAYLSDLLIQAIVLLLTAIVTAVAADLFRFRGIFDGIWIAELFLITWGYPVFFEVYSEGQTPGKRQHQIRVITENGDHLTPIASILRNLLRIVDFLPFGFVAGFFSMLFTSRFQRLGDLVAHTVVITTHEEVLTPW